MAMGGPASRQPALSPGSGTASGASRTNQHGHERGALVTARSRNGPCPCSPRLAGKTSCNQQRDADHAPAPAPRPSECAELCRTAVSRQFRPASCRSHVAAQAGNQARGGSRQAALQGTSNRSGTAGQSARHRAAIVAPADGRHAEQAASMATDAARFAQGPASRRESRPDRMRSAEILGARVSKTLKSHLRLSNLQKGGFDELLHNFA